mgnify:CR=1 FL=1
MIKRILLLLTFVLQFCFLKAGIVILNGLSHSYNVENGKVYKGKIAIENTGNKPQNVKLFLQDFSYTADGTIKYAVPYTNDRTNVGWIKINTNLVTLKAKQKTEVFYEITVPHTISNPGSYWSVIMVEPVEEIRPDHNGHGVNITSIVRYAIQVITDYDSENAKPELTFESIKIEKKDGIRTANIAVINKGNLYCKPKVSLEIYNRQADEKAGTFTSLEMGLLPYTSKTFPINISNLPPEKYNAVVMATDENENAFALNVELEVKND